MAVLLNSEQQTAVEFGDGPLLIIAGAGTGKTTVITERIKFLITERNVKPEEILALTFTEKASSEMEERIDKIMPYGYTQMWISTFHSFCDRILRDEGINIGITPSYKLMSEANSVLLLKKHLFSLDLDYFRPLGNPTKFLEALLQHFSRLQDEDITPQEYIKYSESLNQDLLKKETDETIIEEIKKTQELAHVYIQYSEIKIKEGVMDFSDLIAQALLLLRTRKQILKKYQEQFRYILVDEFQDTNYAQNELAILLAGNRKNVTVVADDDQAIYRWRGAALSNVMQFKNNFPGSKMVTLNQNYRSTQEILDNAYTLIQHNNPNRLESIENISKKLISNKQKRGTHIELIHENRVDEEADAIVRKIEELTSKHKYNYSDIAILVRANNHAQPITQALSHYKIPYQFLGPAQLFHQEEIKDLIAYLKVLANLDDTVSLFRILQMDIFDISMRDISTLLNWSKSNNKTLFETLEHIEEIEMSEITKEKVKKLLEMILRHLEKVKKETGGQILYYFLTDTNLLDSLITYTTEKGEKTAQNVAKFFDKLKTLETLTTDASVYAVVEWVNLMMEMGDSPLVSEMEVKDYNAVNVLTIHSSKGLEFPVVFMVNLVTERFPTRERSEKIPLPSNLIKEILPEGDYHMQEERRLFYVGMTRAMDHLIFTAARFYAEAKREKKISPFVFEALPLIKTAIQENSKTPTQLSLLNVVRDYKEKDIEEIQKDDFKISSISFSHLQAFDICPLHFKAKYLLNLPAPYSAPLTFGLSLHQTLKDFYDLHMEKTNLTENDLLEILRKDWIAGGYSEKEYEKKMYMKGEDILKKYFVHSFDSNKTTLATELPFSFNLNSNLRITGKIDRVDKTDSGIEIIDYKTGKSDSLSKKSYELQVGIYALAATRVDHTILKRNAEEITTTLFYLEEGKPLSKQITQDDINKTEQLVLDKIKEIKSSDFKCSKSILCQNCEYNMLCNTHI